MTRYLDDAQLKTNLSLGKSVEQWLSSESVKDYVIIKWIMIEKGKNGRYNVVYVESFDEGDENSTDVYEFSNVNPDELYGIINTFDSVEDALNFAVTTYNTALNKFVNAGMIQEEYKDYLKRKDPLSNRKEGLYE